jgi:hypothetical protein
MEMKLIPIAVLNAALRGSLSFAPIAKEKFPR